MVRHIVCLLVALLPAIAFADPPAAIPACQFKWQRDQTLTYKVLQRSIIRETSNDEVTNKPVTTEASTNLSIIKKWHVKDVDASGVATLELVIVELRNESVKPDGKKVIVDSSNPQDAAQMLPYLNVPILVAKFDGRGQVVEVKQSKDVSVSRLQAELPFRLMLPVNGPESGQSWERNFTVKLDPPLGTGEAHDFLQKFTCAGLKNGLVAMKVETILKAPPQALAERVPLVPMLWNGDIYFNPAAGKLHAARLRVKAELPNYQGAGSRFEYESTYAEDAVDQ